MNQSFVLSSVVVKSTAHVTNQPALANGKTLRIQKIGMTDESKSAKPSIVRVKFGGVLIRTLCATTATVEINLVVDLPCDGLKFLSVERENTESNDKPITVWVDAYDR